MSCRREDDFVPTCHGGTIDPENLPPAVTRITSGSPTKALFHRHVRQLGGLLPRREWLTTVTFDDLYGSTRLTHTILHRSREARDGHLQAGMEAGSIQTLRRLDEHTAQMSEAAFH